MKVFIKFIRLPNLVVLILIQYLIRFFLIKPFLALNGGHLMLSELNFSLFVISITLLVAAGYIINDFFDMEIDRINRPEKVIIGSKIRVDKARLIYIILNLSGIALATWISFQVGVIKLGIGFFMFAGMAWYYSARYKRMLILGNLIVAFKFALIVFAGWLFEFYAIRANTSFFVDQIRGIEIINKFIWAVTAFVFMVSLIREIIKDLRDVEGDMKHGYKSLIQALGLKRSKVISFTLIIIAMGVVASFQLYLWKTNFDYLFWYLLLIIQPMFIYLIIRLQKSIKKEDFEFVNNICKIILIAGLLSIQLIQLSI
ncbi:MAG: UbiA family prenyltransferase [Bacteroidetes bacterium]|nr:UbiA family prenyltransferase [Bacteroidota bacterium]